jgi:hypothetical protein
MPWREIALRLALIAGLMVALTENAPPWILGPVGVLSIAATAELAVRPYATNGVDRLLRACGALVTVLILVGLGLDLTPTGLTRMSWAVAWTMLSIGVLIWRRGLVTTGIGKAALRVGSRWLWVLGATVILALGADLALAGVRHSNQQPMMAFALESVGTGSVTVKVDDTATDVQYRIAAVSSALGARRYLGQVFTVRAGENGMSVLEDVPINVGGVWTIRLESAGNGTVVRWLRVDVH